MRSAGLPTNHTSATWRLQCRRQVWPSNSFGRLVARHGAGAPSSAAEAPSAIVRGAASDRVHRSVPVPGRDPVPASGGGDRVSAEQQTEKPQAAGHSAESRASGLQLFPSGPGRLQLGPWRTATGAPERTSKTTGRNRCVHLLYRHPQPLLLQHHKRDGDAWNPWIPILIANHFLIFCWHVMVSFWFSPN